MPKKEEKKDDKKPKKLEINLSGDNKVTDPRAWKPEEKN